MDPRTEAYWAGAPVHAKLVVGLNVEADLTGPSSTSILDPLRELDPDTDEKVAAYLADTRIIEDALGGRDAIMAMHQVRMTLRTTRADDAGPWLEYVEAAADDLAATPEDVPRWLVGQQLQRMLHDVVRPFLLHDVLRLMPGVKKVLKENAALLVGHGFTQETIDRGDALMHAAIEASKAATGDLTVQEGLTDELQAVLDRMVAFFRLYARRRHKVEVLKGKKLVGFDRSPIEQWRATRPSEIAARAEAKAAEAAAAATSAPAATGVIAEAMAAFRAGPVT